MSKYVIGFIKIEKNKYYPEDTKDLIEDAIGKVISILDHTVYDVEDIVRYDEGNSVEILVNGQEEFSEGLFEFCKTIQDIFALSVQFMS